MIIFDERLGQSISRHCPGGQMTDSVACSIKEQYASVDGSKKAVVTLRHEGKPAEFDVTEDVNAVWESIVPDICEHIENLIQKFNPEDQEATLKNIILAGGGSRITGLAEMIVEHLAEYGEVNVTAVDDSEFVGSAGALKLATEIPEDMWSQIGVMFDPDS
ncbi:MAG: hypothetical protein ABFS09_10580 [Thermodesulfobacteriota bacterium]